MNRYAFVAPSDLGHTRLLPLIKRMLPELPEYAIREAFEKRDVKVDGVRAPKDAQVPPGAEICLFTPYGGIAVSIPVLFEDENVMVVRKPPGVSCEADQKGGKTIVDLAWALLRDKDTEGVPPLLCHRLDNPTEGILVLAKSETVQRELQEGFRQRRIHKGYTCLVKGTPSPSEATLTAYLLKDAERGRVQVLPRPERGALTIVTEYRVLEKGEVSRLRVVLHTGRTHQIRAQMAAIGHPLLGDDAYGDRDFNKAHKAKRLMLCATELSFSLTGPLAYLNEKIFQIEPMF